MHRNSPTHSPFATRAERQSRAPAGPIAAEEQSAHRVSSTTKYNLFTFLPKNLFEQFLKKANAYFLLVAIVSLTPLSPKTPIVSVAPLVLVLTVSAIKEAMEDWQRYKMDRKINSYWVDVWRSDGKRAPIIAAEAGAAAASSSSSAPPPKGKAPPSNVDP